MIGGPSVEEDQSGFATQLHVGGMLLDARIDRFPGSVLERVRADTGGEDATALRRVLD